MDSEHYYVNNGGRIILWVLPELELVLLIHRTPNARELEGVIREVLSAMPDVQQNGLVIMRAEDTETAAPDLAESIVNALLAAGVIIGGDEL